MASVLDGLNDKQRAAAECTEGPLLLLAGAGSGKTRVIVHRIAYLVEQGVSPFNIMAITFTNKAAREMKERVEKLVRGGSEIWVSTFHSSCARILRREIDKIEYATNFTIYDAADQERVMKDLVKEFNLSDKLFNARVVLNEIGRQKDELISPHDMLLTAEGDFRATQIAKLYEAYQKKLKAANALDFDDLIGKTVELFTVRPDVLERYQYRFRYVMVDEYQDANAAQYQLVRFLSSLNENLCVVGDDDQSIYGWRGANIENILGFEKDFPNATVIRLEQNYRSTQNILNAANGVIEHNKARKGKALWTENGKGDGILYFRANTDSDEGFYVADTVVREKKTGAKYSDFAVLYRTNAQSRSIEEILFKNGLPYRLLGGTRFYERKEIKDLLAYLKIIVNPADDVSVKRIINYPKRGIGETSVNKLQEYASAYDVTFFNACENAVEILDAARGNKVEAFAGVINRLREKKVNAVQLIEAIIADTAFFDALRADAENQDESTGRIENVGELISKAAEFESRAEENGEDSSLEAFLADVSLVADIDSYQEEEDAVVLMTLHSSKGLEFPQVFITGFEENIFPSFGAISSDSENEMEEERRLCYVGITRAQKKLYITNAVSRRRYGHYESNPPSRFLKEIPKDTMHAGAQDRKQALHPRAVSRQEVSGNSKYTPQKVDILVVKEDKPDYDVGDTVFQQKYGEGKVLEIRAAGADYEVTVNFDAFGRKKFMAHLALLKKV